MTPYPNIYGVIPSPATVTVLTGRGTVSEKCTCGIPVVNPIHSVYSQHLFGADAAGPIRHIFGLPVLVADLHWLYGLCLSGEGSAIFCGADLGCLVHAGALPTCGRVSVFLTFAPTCSICGGVAALRGGGLGLGLGLGGSSECAHSSFEVCVVSIFLVVPHVFFFVALSARPPFELGSGLSGASLQLCATAGPGSVFFPVACSRNESSDS